MNILRLDRSSRARLRQLLPWHVNGTLPPAEDAALRALVVSDLATRREWNEARALAAFVAAEEMLQPDLEQQLARTRAHLHAPQRRARATARAHWRVAALLLLPLLGLSAVTLQQLTAPRYSTHADTVPAASVGDLRLRMQVDPGVAARDIDAALQPFGARRVAGPAAPGLHTIAVPPAQRAALERMLAERFAPRYLAPAEY